jgi:hypothetical protein
MPANETTEAVRRSVTDLGRRFGLSPQEFNVGLNLAGLLGGEPGAWWLTEKGKRFAAEHYHHNGYGGHAHRSWDTTTWLETVTYELDLSEAGIERIRQVIADRKLAQKTAREAATAAAEAAFLRTQAAKHPADAAPDVGSATRTRVIVGLGVAVTAYGLYKAVPHVRRRWKQRAGAPEQAEDRD